jgi:PleD family two-component response regulator
MNKYSGSNGAYLPHRLLQEGAQDYLIKGQIEPRELMRAPRNAIKRKIIEEALFQMKERVQVTRITFIKICWIS